MSIKRIADSLYRVTVRIRLAGRIIHRQATVTGNRDSAKAKELEIKADLREGTGGSLTVAKTFGEALRFYTDRHAVTSSESLFYRLESELGNVSIMELAERFDRWLLDFRKRKRKVKEGEYRHYSDATVNRLLAWSKKSTQFCGKT